MLSKAFNLFQLDFNWSTNNGLIDWEKTGRVTDMGHASYAIDSSDQREPRPCPFTSPEEVWAFDAVNEYGLPDFDGQVKAYESIIQHDDFVWTAGPFMNPDIYRKVIIPRYAELWKPLHAAGKKVLFCSDGNFTELAGDVAADGADGLIFEPCNDFDFMVNNFGRTKCLVGSFVDCRDLTFEKWDVVRECVDKTFESLARCKGALFAVGNHLPPNIPAEMLDRYFEYLLPRLKR